MTITFWNGRPQKIYNVDQSKKQYATLEDLENYARVDTNNYFYYFNFFNSIRVKTINDISGNVFDFFVNLTENVQEFFNSMRLRLTNYTYDADLMKTTILNDFKTLDIECGEIYSSNINCSDVQSNSLSSNTINLTKLNSDKIVSIGLKSNKIFCNSMNCDFLEFKNDVGLYLYLNNIMIPITKSISKADLNFSDTIETIKITIKPNYTVELFNNSSLTFTYTNNTNNIQYFISVNNLIFSNLKLYKRNIYIE